MIMMMIMSSGFWALHIHKALLRNWPRRHADQTVTSRCWRSLISAACTPSAWTVIAPCREKANASTTTRRTWTTTTSTSTSTTCIREHHSCYHGDRISLSGSHHFGDDVTVRADEGPATIGSFILSISAPSRDHLTPEVALHLMRPSCSLWAAPAEESLAVLEARGISEPFWAFYWPGGQALTRYLLDKPEVVRGKSVLDVGSGCGASAIAAAMAGAGAVLANDIDPAAVQAIKLNAAENDVDIATTSRDLIGRMDNQWDVVLLGDMFYDRSFADTVVDWLSCLADGGMEVLIGDPGRLSLQEHPIRQRLTQAFEVELLPRCKEENNGMTHGFVWQLPPSHK